jgi:hypothetical protein
LLPLTRFAGGILWSVAALGCESRAVPADAGLSEPSPNASILPAPLAASPETNRAQADAGLPSDAGLDAELPAPSAAREDSPLSDDGEELHDTSGVKLKGRFRWPDVVLPARLPETNSEALERARSSATFDVEVVCAAAGRLRVGLSSSRFVLPTGSELRARTVSYGHVLVWPDAGRYVTVQPGALRALLNERRADVIPLTHATGTPRGASQALGFPAERVALATPLGHVELEQAEVAAAGAGGPLLCRLLLELAGVHPDSAACRAELVPVRAEYSWSEGARLVFETSALERVPAFEASSLKVPPEHAEHRIGEVPTPSSSLLTERNLLRSIRLKPALVRPAKDAPKDGLLLVNADDLLRYALVDGWPVARLEARGGGLLLDLLPGTYSISVRTFLGDEATPPIVTSAPGRLVTGEAPRPEP